MQVIYYIFVLYCVFNNTILYSIIKNIEYSEFNKNLEVESNDLNLLNFFSRLKNVSCIATLIDRYGNKFILKQKLNSSLSSVLEKLAADIAHSVGILANHIKLIPCNVPFIGKKRAREPATLHTFVPGVLVNRLPKIIPHYAISLQLVGKEKKEDNSVEKTFGITRDIIKNMSVHPDLPKIVALDTFIANHDRHRGNLFYDKVTDHFYAIDLEGSFRKDLAKCIAEYFYITVPRENIIFSPEEKRGLIVYRDTLKKLINKHNPDCINKKINHLLYTLKIEWAQSDLLLISKYQLAIEKNYASCKKLVEILDVLLAHYNN